MLSIWTASQLRQWFISVSDESYGRLEAIRFLYRLAFGPPDLLSAPCSRILTPFGSCAGLYQFGSLPYHDSSCMPSIIAWEGVDSGGSEFDTGYPQLLVVFGDSNMGIAHPAFAELRLVVDV